MVWEGKNILGVSIMQLTDQLHAFIWESYTVNNCNTYFIDGPTRILIDPGHIRLFDHVQRGLANLGLTIDDIGLVVCTHAHPDHIEAVQLFKDTNALIAIHEREWQLVKEMETQISASLGVDLEAITPDFFLKEGDFSVQTLSFKVLHSPGHSPGSATLYWVDQKALFTGDVIFKESVGRTDLPGGNGSALKESIRQLQTLDVEWLLSGHGEVIAGSKAVQENFDQVVNYWFNYI